MSQFQSSSSTYAHVSPTVAVRGFSHNYVLSFALLVLATAIFFFSTVTNSSASSESPLRTNYAKKQVGECFEFGRYPQGDKGEIEPIIWRVLHREADHLLVIAEQGLDCKPYHADLVSIDWSGCTLRRWLNDEFYDKAFGARERECVLKTSIVNNEGPNTEDCVFLLSVDEVKSLFANDVLRCANPTGYAVKNGVWTNDNGCCCWWLRSRGINGYYAAYVGMGGIVCVDGSDVNHDFRAVRPSLKLAL